MISAYATTIAAEPVFTTENIGVLTAFLVALSGFIATIVAARSKSKLDAVGELQQELKKAKQDLSDAEDRHDREIARYEQRVTDLEARLAERDRAISKLDRLVLALRAYVARLSRHIIDRGDEVPPRPVEIDQ
ncbi:hypothetical protein [Rhodococcus sp. JVH1]|uniref:hypothetical protein n=1 Tax=Rhodococcus sp. JVH1 TaxID=745408 RepID=UPI0002720D21|nr:hypothetical protein [Rhodococcus sp. JVH1]EJJ01052.1 hypothetical protein JVH1_1678 [Rhodococcus sp. JVH1]